MTPQSAEGPPTELDLATLPRPSRKRRLVFRGTTFENVEDVTLYRPGGHHPINLGDVVGRKFKIIHKLGSGGFAIVWLARDLEQGGYVALKILRADASDRESRILEHLKNAASNSAIVNLHESFTIRGPNGLHQCLVLDPGGPSLHHLYIYSKRPPLPFVKAAARKLAQGLAAIHSAGVCHGDLTDSNVLFQITGLQDWTEDEIFRYLGPPKTDPLLLLDGTPVPGFAPTRVVDALNWSHLSSEQLSSDVLIVDFGEAFFTNDVPKDLGTPVSFYGPEMNFGYPPSCAVDLWALGCLIFEFHTFRCLLPTGFGSSMEALAMAVETIGAIPEEWQHSYLEKNSPAMQGNTGKKHPWYDDKIERTRWTLESRLLEQMPELSQQQRKTFLQLLRSIVIFEPSHRLSAAEVANHPWFTSDS